jgi:hypothetical protein
MANKQLLTEGGAAGHMSHPYENIDLTFSKLKEMFKLASQGFPGIKVTEKLDGQNIFISYDTVKQEALAVRNKTQAIAGGANKDALTAALTTDRPVEKRVPQEVVDAYRDSLTNFETMANTVPGEYFVREDGGRIFYNAEVMDPRSPNVVDYDAQTLAIHRVGHLLVKDGTVQKLETSESEIYAIQLEEILQNLQSDSNMPSVKVNAINNFKDFLEKKDAYKRVISNIDSIVRDVNMSDSQSIKEYLESRVALVLGRKLANLSFAEEAIIAMSEAVVFYGSEHKLPRIKTEVAAALSKIPEHLTQEREICLNILRDRVALKELSSAAALPLINIIHKFAVEILENFTSAYIIQSDIAVNKLKKKVGQKIKDVRSAADAADLQALQIGMQKILGGDISAEEALSDSAVSAAIEKISTAVEGLVFEFEGKTYKLTGNFAPINQIMGLGRYKRAKKDVSEEILGEDAPDVDNIEVEDERQKPTRKIAVFPGKFKPPHRGHLHLVVETLARGADKVVILISPLTKGDISAEESAAVWNLYLAAANINPSDVVVLRSPYNSPVMTAYAIMDEPIPALSNLNIPASGDMIIPVASTKPDERGVSDIQRFAKFHKYMPKMDGLTPGNVQDWAIDPAVDESGAFNASDFRVDLDNNSDISRYIPKNVSQEEVRKVLGFFYDTEDSQRNSLNEDIFSLVEEVFSENDWQPIAKKRMKKSMKRILQPGRKDITKYGSPFTINPNIGKSNAFIAKEGEEVQLEEDAEELEEISAMGAGSVAGFAGVVGRTEKDGSRIRRKRKKETN